MADKMTTVYMIRHGESEASKRDTYLGHFDLPLTQTGRTQARLAADYLQTLGADVIYASDLSRAYQTACETAQRLQLPVHKDARLREMYMGQWEDVSFEQVRRAYPVEFARWCEDFENAAAPDGESVKQLQERVLLAVRELAQAHPGQRVMIFSHGTPVRAMAAHAMGQSIGSLPWPANASVTTLHYCGGVFSCPEYSRDDFMGELVTRLPEGV